MHKKGYHITNYIDDLIGCDSPEIAVEAYKFLKSLIVNLGLVTSESKLYPPQTCIPCLGINVNVTTGVMSIPEDKLASIIEMYAQWVCTFINASIQHDYSLTGYSPQSGKPLQLVPSCSQMNFIKTWPGLIGFFPCSMTKYI